ncbi:putative holin-like toxin [Pseudoneobacillus sp. C159]
MTTHEVLTLLFAALSFETVLISTIVAIVVAITKKK